MSLLGILRSGVKIADKYTRDIQTIVMFQHTTGVDFKGNSNALGAAVPLKAVVDWKQQNVRTAGGQLTVSRVSVLFLDIDALNAATGGEGVSDEDVIVLPDGTTGPIIDMSGFIDAGTGHPIATEVFLG